MAKMMIVGRRRGGMTTTELHTYMVDVHGAMVVDYIGRQPEAAPQRYVQNHVFDGSFRAGAEAGDSFGLYRVFVTQVWFESPAHAKASLETSFYLDQLRPDEDRFVDQDSVVQIPVAEHELLAAHTAAQAGVHSSKVFVFLKRAPSVTRNDFLGACERMTKPLRIGPAAQALGICRWVHNECLSRPGTEAQIDAIEEIWLDSEAAARSLGAELLGLAGHALSGLVAPGSTCLLLARERVLHAGSH